MFIACQRRRERQHSRCQPRPFPLVRRSLSRGLQGHAAGTAHCLSELVRTGDPRHRHGLHRRELCNLGHRRHFSRLRLEQARAGGLHRHFHPGLPHGLPERAAAAAAPGPARHHQRGSPRDRSRPRGAEPARDRRRARSEGAPARPRHGRRGHRQDDFQRSLIQRPERSVRPRPLQRRPAQLRLFGARLHQRTAPVLPAPGNPTGSRRQYRRAAGDAGGNQPLPQRDAQRRLRRAATERGQRDSRAVTGGAAEIL